LFPVTQLGLINAFGRGICPALRTDKFVFWTSDGSTIAFICSVGTVLVAIAVPADRNTSMVLAPELTTVARREIAFFLIGTVCAFLTMVAFLKFCYALLPVGTSELGEVAGRTRAPGFVRFVAAVKVPVALLILGHAEAIAALMILTLACTIIAVLFVGTVIAIRLFITAEVAGDTIGCIEFVRSTGKLTSITLGGGTVIFVLAIFTIFVVVTLPPLGDAFS